jgi:hypothetical protein
MSYNIDSTQYISGKLRIRPADVKRLLKKYEGDLPEDCFLYDIACSGRVPVDIESPSWQGTWSGNSYELLEKTVLPFTTGQAVIAFIWEGGDSITALEVIDGVVKARKAKISVELEEP